MKYTSINNIVNISNNNICNNSNNDNTNKLLVIIKYFIVYKEVRKIIDSDPEVIKAVLSDIKEHAIIQGTAPYI